jgi:hypothetical protein
MAVTTNAGTETAQDRAERLGECESLYGADVRGGSPPVPVYVLNALSRYCGPGATRG